MRALRAAPSMRIGQTACQAVNLLILVALIAGCASSGRQRRGKLSDAAAKASDENTGSREAETTPPPWWEAEDGTDPLLMAFVPSATDTLMGPTADGTAGYTMSPKKDDPNTVVGLLAGSGILGGDDLYGMQHLTLAVGADVTDRLRGEVRFGLVHAPVQEASILHSALKHGIWIGRIGVAGKWFLTPRHTFMGMYLLAGGSYNYMWWTYRNAITADIYDDFGNVIGSETIEHDELRGIELFVGAGWHIVQTRSFQFGGEVTPGLMLWDVYTKEGFDNDVIDSFGFVRFSLLLNFNFSR